MSYGHAPEDLGTFDLDWDEYMHYMYLPVVMKGMGAYRIPQRLMFLSRMIEEAANREGVWNDAAATKYVYVTARRGWATPGNPLNRPGWHCDGFGTDDVNYIWTDAYPTLFSIQKFENISDDHVESIKQFGEQHNGAGWYYEPKKLLRLDPYVIHRAPEIPEPGGERGFVKISFSSSQYNLKGNSHNYLFDYDWKMHDRAELRNDPAYAGGDAGPQ